MLCVPACEQMDAISIIHACEIFIRNWLSLLRTCYAFYTFKLFNINLLVFSLLIYINKSYSYRIVPLIKTEMTDLYCNLSIFESPKIKSNCLYFHSFHSCEKMKIIFFIVCCLSLKLTSGDWDLNCKCKLNKSLQGNILWKF